MINVLPVIFLTFCMLGLHMLHTGLFFYHTKVTLMGHEHRNDAPTTTAVGLHTGALNN